MSRLPDRPCPSGPGTARPALCATAHEAVRPRAFSSSALGGRYSQMRLCLPARARSGIVGRGYAGIAHSQPWLCFSAPRPVQYRLGWLAMARRAFGPGGVGTGTLVGTVLGTLKPLNCFGLCQSSHCSRPGRAHVIRSRAHAHRNVSLSLGTWEQRCISYSVQRLGAFLRPFPARAAVGTWEQAKALPSSPDRLCGAANKIEAGYADLRWFGGGGRRKFRGSARVLEAGSADQAQLAGATGGNGGFPPFLGGRIGHVGRLDVGTVAKGERDQRSSGARQKLCRLHGSALGAIGARLAGLGQAARSVEATPGPPIAVADLPCTLALTFGRISIEDPFRPKPVQPSGLFPDRLTSAGPERVQTWPTAEGAGGICGAPRRSWARSAGRLLLEVRAGVISPSAGLQAPASGGFRTLGLPFARVNSGSGAAV